MKALALLVALALLGVALPNASADPCVTDASAISIGDHYLGLDASIWEETNPLAGLQRTSCEDDNGREIRPDTRVL